MGESGSEKRIRVLIVDDHEVVRRGLALFLLPFDDFELVGAASDGLEALTVCEEVKPDVILMDIVMPGMDGVAATRVIREKYPATQIIGLSTFKDEDMVREMLKSGATGYLLKNAAIDELANAIRTAMTGKMILSPEAAKALIHAPARPVASRYNLTEREREVLGLMVEGLNNIEIAGRLFVARSTVKFHVSSILAKLNVTSRVEAVSLALQVGLIK